MRGGCVAATVMPRMQGDLHLEAKGAHGMAGLPKMLRSDEVADVLNVSHRVLYGLVASGDLPATKIGNEYRFFPTDVSLLLERARVEVAS